MPLPMSLLPFSRCERVHASIYIKHDREIAVLSLWARDVVRHILIAHWVGGFWQRGEVRARHARASFALIGHGPSCRAEYRLDVSDPKLAMARGSDGREDPSVRTELIIGAPELFCDPNARQNA